MARSIFTPRVNNNDDTVRIAHLYVEPGTLIKAGDMIADVETDKATFTVEAEEEGYLLAFNGQKGDTVAVGSVLAWLGSSSDEPLPQSGANGHGREPASESGGVSLKAAILLAQHGIEAGQVPREGPRLSAADVERYIAQHGIGTKRDTAKPALNPAVLSQGKTVPLSPKERGMLRTVEWQSREAVAAYVEIAYEEAGWAAYAQEFQARHKLLVSPLLPLIAYRLANIAQKNGIANSTIQGTSRHEYDHVNLGFTVQVGEDLYVAVVQEADTLDELSFVRRLGELQRAAMKKSLRPQETEGATIGFSSMARWGVTRHLPILLPYTAMMVAHTAARDGVAHVGATYDHRVLTGAAAAQVLRQLAQP
jgi:pyruvate/2-oxoglutarate dehydrogenase complex dihydrolipoamide acyltransferase (E2) component